MDRTFDHLLSRGLDYCIPRVSESIVAQMVSSDGKDVKSFIHNVLFFDNQGLSVKMLYGKRARWLEGKGVKKLRRAPISSG